MKHNKLLLFLLIVSLAFALSACKENHADVHAEEHGHMETATEEGHDDIDVVLEDNAQKMIGLEVGTVSQQKLYKEIHLSGQIVENKDKLQHVYPRFSGMVKEVFVCTGDTVSKGQTLAIIQNNETLTEYAMVTVLEGIVTNKDMTVGEIVNEDSKVMTVADLRDVWVEFDVHTKDIDDVKKGQTVTITILGLDREIQGTITYISPVMDAQKRTMTARVVLSNPKGIWVPGIFVKGILTIPTEISGLAVPNDAIQIVEEKKAVFVPEDEHTFTAVFIETGEYDNDHTLITSGLSLNDPFVSKGAFELKAKLVTSSLGGHAGHGH
jgi:membrane fusion protein, heavy metal efflux system